MAGGSKRPARKLRAPGPVAEERAFQSLDFSRKNWILLAAGLASIAVGFGLLAAGDISIAPVLLVAGYLGLIPWALVTHGKKSDSGVG